MATAYTTLLGLALPVTGELNGTWGTVVNDSITELVEDAIAGSATASVTSADWTLTTTGSGAANQARSAILIPTGTPGVSRNIIAPSSSKAYIVDNQSNAAVVIKGSATTGATIAAGTAALVAWDGTDFVLVSQDLANATGTLPVSKGGTGATTLTGVVKGTGTSALTAGTVNLASEVTGTLPVANGGTGATTLTANNVILGNGTSAVQVVAPGTTGNVLTSNGTTWTSSALPNVGDVDGPGSSTDNAIARFDGTTGKIIQNSTVTIADSGAATFNSDVTIGGLLTVTANPVVQQTDIGTAPNEIPLNQYLGNLAYQNAGSIAGNVVIGGGVTAGDASVISANSTSAALRITQTGTGNALLVEDSANPDSTPFVINTNGVVIQGKTTARTNYFAGTTIALLQGQDFLSVDRGGAFDAGPAFILSKNRGATGDNTIVVAQDTLGQISFQGADGTNLIPSASIQGQVDGTPGTNDMPGRLVFSTTADGASSPTERMRIDSAGRFGFGTSTAAGTSARFGGSITGSTFSVGIGSEQSVQSDVTSAARIFQSRPTTQATTWTLGTLSHFYINPQTFGAGTTVTNQIGFHVESSLTGATNNYGFYSNIASGTGRWNFYAAGSADNYFAGNVGIGTTAPSAPLEVSGSSASIVVRATAAGQSSFLIAAASDYSTSFRGCLLFQNNASATGTTLGLSNAGLSVLNFQNSTGAAILTNGSNNLRIGTSNTTAIQITSAQITAIGGVIGAESLRVNPVASAVNFLDVAGGATGIGPILSSQGSDTNIDLRLVPKGTGALSFGTYTAGIIAQAGSITIKDAAGNTRRLLVG